LHPDFDRGVGKSEKMALELNKGSAALELERKRMVLYIMRQLGIKIV